MTALGYASQPAPTAWRKLAGKRGERARSFAKSAWRRALARAPVPSMAVGRLTRRAGAMNATMTVLAGTRSSQCDIGGWTRDSATQCQCTPKVCPAASPAAHATACPVGHYGTNVCSVTCEPGYEIVSGNNIYRCFARGNWESVGIPLECKRTCEPQLPVLHSKPCQASDGREKPAEDEKCVGQCKEGYVVNRISVYTCDDTGIWVQTNQRS